MLREQSFKRKNIRRGFDGLRVCSDRNRRLLLDLRPIGGFGACLGKNKSCLLRDRFAGLKPVSNLATCFSSQQSLCAALEANLSGRWVRPVARWVIICDIQDEQRQFRQFVAALL